jgi:hypothetical protein
LIEFEYIPLATYRQLFFYTSQRRSEKTSRDDATNAALAAKNFFGFWILGYDQAVLQIQAPEG